MKIFNRLKYFKTVLQEQFYNYPNSCRVFSLSSMIGTQPFYLVVKGRKPGIYSTWNECESQVTKFPKAHYKKFKEKVHVLEYLQKVIHHTTTASSSTSSFNNVDIPLLESLLNEYKQKWSITVSPIDDIEGNPSTNDDSFNLDSDGYLVMYTDGACSKNGSNDAVAGIGVYFGPDNPLNASMVIDGKTTNNSAEIQAAVIGLRRVKELGYKKVKVMTDSEFLINCSTKWIRKWSTNDWKKSNGNEVVNKSDLIELKEVVEGMSVKWYHVRGHQGVSGNEEADALARASIERLKRNESL